jgi:hypothetical protein
MNSPEKEYFLKVYRDMLEFKDGFDDGVGREYAEYCGYIEHVQNEYKNGNWQGWENMQTFSEFFLELIRPIYKKIDDWLFVLPATQQKEEAITLRTQINYYIGLSEKYTLTKRVFKEINGIKKPSTTEVPLNKVHPVIKKSLEIILERLAKYLNEEQPVLDTDSPNNKNKEFTTARQVVAIMLLNQEFKLFKTQDNINIQRFIEFLTSKTPRDIGDFIKKFNESPDRLIHTSKKQNQKDYEFLKEIFEKADCKKVTDEIGFILLEINKLKD